MSYSFDDVSSQYITFGDVTFLDGLTQISGHCWVNLDDIAADHSIFGKTFNLPPLQGFVLFFDNVGSASGRTDIFTIYMGNDVSSIKVEGATNSASAGSWYSVGFSYDGAALLRLYINGIEDANSPVVATAIPSFQNQAGTLDVGRSSHGIAYMDGKIGGCALWNTVLSDEDFSNLSKGYDPSLIQPSNLLWAPRFISDAIDYKTVATGTVSGATVSTLHHSLHIQEYSDRFIDAGINRGVDRGV